LKRLVIATRKSPLALAQSERVAAQFRQSLGIESELLKIVTTGDRQTEWSLEKKGGKGLFTSELEQAVLRGEADIAVHSTKDLPGEMDDGLEVAGYLPREDPRDVLVLRADTSAPKLIATGSPRRRLQLKPLFPEANFTEIRGNVDTRLRKIAELGVADATVLAAAGLIRLGIHGWPGLLFRKLECVEMVPAVGQAAIAVQARHGEGSKWLPVFDPETYRAVSLERAFQRALGAGCHTAVAVHVSADLLSFYHEHVGFRQGELAPEDFADPHASAARWLRAFGLQG